MTHRIMLVDDDQAVLNSLTRLLRAVPCSCGDTVYPLEVEAFTSPLLALERARHTAFELVLTDYRMLEMNGVEILRQMQDIQPDAARLILSGYGDLNVLMRAINEVRIYRFIAKPWNDYELVAAIGQALDNRRLLLENRHLADERRLEMGKLTPEELEAKRLEALEPGITKVRWGPDGSVILDQDFDDLD